ncbi:MAG: prolipoprotein diacylglyceryl transferase [Acidimicrobiia bacterium]
MTVLATIPYETFPEIDLGPIPLRSFGLLVAVGVLVGAVFAARYGEEWGIPREQTYRLATWMVLAGVVGSRITWVLTHLDRIDSPVDVIAIWEGGLQFSGGFIAAIVVGYPIYSKWSRLTRWRSLDGCAYGLTIGLAIGRIACYSVGEHFGSESSFLLATRYEGGDVREGSLGEVPLRVGMSFHNTALYELLYLLVLFVVLTLVLYGGSRRAPTGTAIGIFCAWYGVARFGSDALRVNDERVLGLTGAQWMCLALLPTAAWVLLRVRGILAAEAAEADRALAAAAAPDEVEAPDPSRGA